MKVEVLEECGYEWAKLGTSLSRNQPVENMDNVCSNLAPKDGGHNKFLELMAVWIDINAPRNFWQEMATFRVGNSWLSESTMYTLTKSRLSQDAFERPIPDTTLYFLNQAIAVKDLDEAKNQLPEGFLQRRIMVTNYKALRNIISQRKNHKMLQWRIFCEEVMKQLQHPELLGIKTKGEIAHARANQS